MSATDAPSADRWHRLDALCARAEPAAIKVRRHLHRYPELSWQETRTQAFLEAWLAERGLTPVQVAKTGLYVDIGEGDAPVVYRADIDALPVQDAKQPGMAACISEVPGVSHACGHDLHSAVAAGLADVLQSMRDELPGRVRIVFQPAEETLPSGGEAILKSGALDGLRAALALHADPTRDAGTVGLFVGPLTATADAFTIEVMGRAGHSARPHLARDALLAAADVVRALHSIVGQRVDPLETAVLNVGTLTAGEAHNVIAGRARLAGIIRTLQPDIRELVHRELREVAEAAARVHGCSVDVHLTLGSPPIVNDARLHEVVRRAAGDVVGASGAQLMKKPSTGSEDFGQYGRHAPVYMVRLGVRSPGGPTLHLHTPGFDVDERAIGVAIRLMARSVIDAFAHLDAPGGE